MQAQIFHGDIMHEKWGIQWENWNEPAPNQTSAPTLSVPHSHYCEWYNPEIYRNHRTHRIHLNSNLEMEKLKFWSVYHFQFSNSRLSSAPWHLNANYPNNNQHHQQSRIKRTYIPIYIYIPSMPSHFIRFISAWILNILGGQKAIEDPFERLPQTATCESEWHPSELEK